MPRRVTAASFVGREGELGRLLAAAEVARRGGGSQLVLVGGDAGIGKTRLIEELCLRWRLDGGTAAIGGCVDVGAGGAGYAPLVEVLRDLRDQLGAEVLAALLDEAAPDLRPLLTGRGTGHEVRQGSVLAQVVELFGALGARCPGIVVVFEDLHWADPSTQDLVAYLSRNLRSADVALVLSYRADDVHRRHPLRPLLTELARSPLVDVVSLQGMSRSEITVLLASVSGTVPLDVVVDDVLARSEGNPFYAEELAAAEAWGGGLPATLRDAILGRIAGLPDPAPAVLREAALLGEHIDERLLAVVTGRPVEDVGAALHDAIAHRVLVAEAGGCRFRHALVREAAYDDLLPGERPRLHAAAAAALTEHADLGPEAPHARWSLLAHHWTAAQDQPHAFRASVRAALACEAVGAMAAASAHHRTALELWPRMADPESLAGLRQGDLLLRAADAAHHAGAPAEAVRLVEQAVALTGVDGEPEERAILLQRLGEHRWAACDEVGSGEARAAAVAVLADRPPSAAQAHVLAAHGAHLMLTDQFLEAEPVLVRALEVGDRTGAAVARSRALTALGHVRTKLGRPEAGIDAAREALTIAVREGTADDIGRAYVMLTATLMAAARYEEVVAVAVEGLEHARRTGMLASDGVLLGYNHADALIRLGRWDEAEATLAAVAGDPYGPFGTTGAVLSARLALWQGRLDAAAHHRDRSLAPTAQGNRPTAEALAVAALLAAVEGRFDDARRAGGEALERAAGSEDPALLAAVGAAAIEIEADRVEAIAGSGPASKAGADGAQARSDDVLAMVHDRLRALDERGLPRPPEAVAFLATAEAEHGRAWGRADPEPWSAAAAAWDDLACPYFAAVARYREADATLRSRGPRARAAAAARRALATAEALRAAPLAAALRRLAERGRLDLDAVEPSFDVGPDATPDPITALGVSKREREVLELLAQGRTNRQIADQLYISDKTASVHVTHLLRKLGVATRIEAAAVAQRLGLGSDPE